MAKQPDQPRRRRKLGQDAPAPADAQLRALIDQAIPRRTVLLNVPLAHIHPNPFQPRRTFDAIDELADAIRTQGFVSRLRLRPHPELPDHFQLVYGERRVRAAEAAGLAEVPCEISDHTDAEMAELGLMENIQRRDLDPLEEARAIWAVMETGGHSVRAIAERLGKTRGYIDNRLALLRAPDDIQRMLEQRPHTIIAARDLASLPNSDARQELIDGLAAGRISTTFVRDRVREVRSTVEQARARIRHESQMVTMIMDRWQAQAQDADQREVLLEELERLLGKIEQLSGALDG
ncbi:MAG TPA: ParB/RepB/Spo0J family partition protein [Herpetosiphonaceae bacterium]